MRFYNKIHEVKSGGAISHGECQIFNESSSSLGCHLLSLLIRRRDALESRWLTASAEQFPEGKRVLDCNTPTEERLPTKNCH